MAQTMAHQRVGNCIVLVHSANPPADDEWNRYLDSVVQNKIEKLVVVSNGGSPSAKQRQRLYTVLVEQGKLSPLTAVLTESVIARGAVTALSWFKPVLKAFPMKDLPAALEFIQVPAAYETQIRTVINKISVELGAGKV